MSSAVEAKVGLWSLCLRVCAESLREDFGVEAGRLWARRHIAPRAWKGCNAFPSLTDLRTFLVEERGAAAGRAGALNLL